MLQHGLTAATVSEDDVHPCPARRHRRRVWDRDALAREKIPKIVDRSGSVVCQFCSANHRLLLGRRPLVLPAHQGIALVVLHKLRQTPAGLPGRWTRLEGYHRNGVLIQTPSGSSGR